MRKKKNRDIGDNMKTIWDSFTDLFWQFITDVISHRGALQTITFFGCLFLIALIYLIIRIIVGNF